MSTPPDLGPLPEPTPCAWAHRYSPRGLLHTLRDNQQDAEDDAAIVGGSAHPVPLYDSATLEAAVEAERQRCYMLGVAAASQWRPIETAPRLGSTMYVVRGFFVTNVNANVRDYTTDAYFVWPDPDGGWVRWPHTFPPTHWMPLPSAPTKEGG